MRIPPLLICALVILIALPSVQMLPVSPVSGSRSTPHTITVDGSLADWHADENMGEESGKTLYMTWDSSNIYFGWDGSDWSVDGTLFFYFNTTTGGSRTSIDWDGTHTLPFKADYALAVDDGSYTTLRASSDWTQEVPFDGQVYAGYSENPVTEVSIPLSEISASKTVGIIVFAQWEINQNVWAAFPTENPASQDGHETFTYYYNANLTSGQSPNETAVVRGKSGVEPRPDALNLAIIWHMHQPYYKNVLTGMYEMPWVRVHASQEYIDSPEILMQHPGVKVTFNLVPSLVEQIEDYANNDVYDWHTYWAEKGIDNLTDEEAHTMQFQFFWTPNWTYNSDLPASRYYHYLYNKTKHNLKPDTIMDDTLLPKNELLDLEVCWFLFQLSPWYVEGRYNASDKDQRILDLYQKYGGFTLDDLHLVLAKQKEMIGKVMDMYRQVRDNGQAEITVSPYYHPILPLLMMDHWYGDSGDYVDKGVWRDDTMAQLDSAADLYRKYFSAEPDGLWPSEESVSQSVISPIADAGFKWMVSDEMVLQESGFDTSDNNVLCRPYIVSQDGRQVDMVFRDRVISDRIAWQYGKMTPKAAVDDFMDYLKNVRDSLNDPANSLITVALDGENWMFMSFDTQDNGRPFLNELYSRLENTDWIRTTTPSEFIAKHPPDPKVQSIETLARDAPNGAGSWIDGTMSTWAGEPDEDQAWERLAAARQTVDDYAAAHPNTTETQKAKKAIYAAEGSDWFWWYGLDQDSGYDELWDLLFKTHLKAAYDAVGAELPPYLKTLWLPPQMPDTAGSGRIEPIIDGTALPGEWDGADVYLDDEDPGVESDLDIRAVYVGFDASNLFARIDMQSSNLSALVGDEDADISLYIGAADATDMNILGANYVTKYSAVPLNFPARFKIKILLSQVLTTGMTSYAIYEADGSENWIYKMSLTGDTAAVGSIVELSVPLTSIGIEAGNEFRIKVATARIGDAKELDIVPERPISLTIPIDISPEIELLNLTDPVGDETGDGDYTYPTANDFAPGHGLWDITRTRISATEYHLIFRITFAEMTNIWNMRKGYSHQIIQIYIDTDRVPGSGERDMLEGANARVTKDFAWEVAVSATGDGAYAVKDGQKTTDGVDTSGDTKTKTVEISVSKKIVGSDVASYGYVIIVGSQDGFGVGKWREVDPVASAWTLGGGADANPDDGKQYDPSIIDMVLPEGDTNQTKYLSSYDVASKTYAELPGITIPELKQQIYGLKVNGITGNTAVVSWQTTKPSDCTVSYGTSPSGLSNSVISTSNTTEHSVILSDLSPSTTYYLQVTSNDEDAAKSDVISFNTTAVQDTTAPMILIPTVKVLSETSVELTWSTNEVATCSVTWGNSSWTNSTGWDEFGKNHQAVLTLPAGGRYTYTITARDSAGNTNTTLGVNFTTLEDDTGPTGNTGGSSVGGETGVSSVWHEMAQGTTYLAFNEYLAVNVNTSSAGRLAVDFSASEPVDVLVMPTSDLDEYKTLASGQKGNLRFFNASYLSRNRGIVYVDCPKGNLTVIFDNTFAPPAGAFPSIGISNLTITYNITFSQEPASPVVSSVDVSYMKAGKVTVEKGSFVYVKLSVREGELINAYVESADSEEKFDLLLLTSGEFDKYRKGEEFRYYSCSMLSTAGGILYFKAPSTADYYLVMDCTPRPEGGAAAKAVTISMSVSVSDGLAVNDTGASLSSDEPYYSTSGYSMSSTLWYTLNAILLVIVAVLVYLFMRKKESNGGDGSE